MSTTVATLPNLRKWLPPGVSVLPVCYVMWIFSAMYNAGHSEEAVIDLFLREIGAKIRWKAKHGSASAKADLIRSVSEFSAHCEELIAPDRPRHSGHH